MARSNYRRRLNAAISACRWRPSKYVAPREIKTLDDLLDALESRSKSDRSVDDIFLRMLGVLEHKTCVVSHCEKFTTSGMCNCADDLIPAKCPKSCAFVRRQNERAAALRTEIAKRLGEAGVPIERALLAYCQGWPKKYASLDEMNLYALRRFAKQGLPEILHALGEKG